MEDAHAPLLAFRAIADAMTTLDEADHAHDDEDALLPYLYLAFLVDLVRGGTRPPTARVKAPRMPADDVLPAPFEAMRGVATAIATLDPADDDDEPGPACVVPLSSTDALASFFAAVLRFFLAAVAFVGVPFRADEAPLKRTASKDHLNDNDLASVAGHAGSRLFRGRSNNSVRLRNAL
mmetsp:Transcript_25097/g.81144  ORF Transcript_25097/g.81144 Transcript_25097/m.81144 type:complete len:179 (+) Transcript_25097:191-727(+)